MNVTKGLKRIVLVLAIAGAAVGVVCTSAILMDQGMNWWGNAPGVLVALTYIAAVLGGALAGFAGVWVTSWIIWFMGRAIHGFFRWIALGFDDKGTRG